MAAITNYFHLKLLLSFLVAIAEMWNLALPDLPFSQDGKFIFLWIFPDFKNRPNKDF